MSPGRRFDEQTDRNTLFDVEDILVPVAVGRHLLLFQVPVQVEQEQLVEGR